MKRLLCRILLLTVLFCMLPIHGNAVSNQLETVSFDDGSYMTIEVICSGTRASGTVSGQKPYTYYGSDGNAKWKAVVSGSFSYTGSRAVCTSSSVDVTIYASSWYTLSKSATKSGNTAKAYVTIGEKQGGVTVTKIPVSLSLSCDKDGKLS